MISILDFGFWILHDLAKFSNSQRKNRGLGSGARSNSCSPCQKGMAQSSVLWMMMRSGAIAGCCEFKNLVGVAVAGVGRQEDHAVCPEKDIACKDAVN